MRVREAVIGDGRMTYAEGGGDGPLLFIHGFPFDHRMWRYQIEALGQSRHVLAPDLIGFGGSQGTPRETLDAHADDLAALLDHVGVERAVVVGLSMGGYVALAMWRRHAERVSGLVLADTRSGADSEGARAGRYQVIRSVEEQGVEALVNQMLPNLLGADASAAVRSEVRAIMLEQSADGVVAALKAMAARPDSTALLNGVDVPSLVVVGSEDTITPPAESEAMHGRLPNAKLVQIPRAGHLAPLEEPGAFNAALRSFLAESVTPH